MLNFILFIALFLGEYSSYAEPWLSTRFAQNCAGCHAPGRINLQPKDRRCSLSCQGCHINPNGGGIRSLYGKWNEDKLLRSWIIKPQTKTSLHSLSFAPHKKQVYSKKPFKRIKKKNKSSKKFKNFITNRGFKLKTTDDPDIIDADHDRFANPYDRTAESDIEFLYQIPRKDPYRRKFDGKFDGGGDLRWQYVSGEVESIKDGVSTFREVDQSFLMVADFGVRYRPVYQRYHMVYEARMLGVPNEDSDVQVSDTMTRSLYFLVDDLPYNIFIMSGYYRPLFGNYSPDHTLLSQELQARALGVGRSYLVGPYRAVSVGTAPNVPYANLHLIDDNINNSQMMGFVVNLGLRFVKKSASVNYSYWDTKNRNLITKMHSIHLGAKFGRFITNYEGLSIYREDQKDIREGGVHFLDLNIEAHKRIYAVLQYSISNVDWDIKPGSVSQTKAGVKGFLYPGVELQFLHESHEAVSDIDKVSMRKTAISSQLHLYM